MEEKYWKRFMTSGRIEDYLYSRGMKVCMEIMRKYRDMETVLAVDGREKKASVSEGFLN